MPAVITCPECDASLKLKAPPTPGKKVKCPKCEAVFVPESAEARRVSAERPLPPAPAPRRRAQVADDDHEEDARPRRPRPRKKGGKGLLIGLFVGGCVLGLLLACGGVGVFLWQRGFTQVGRNSNVQPLNPVAQQNPAAPGNPVPPAAGPGPNQAANPAPNPGVPRNAPPVAVAPAGLYGELGGEQAAPADPSLPDTLLRARAGDTFYKLSNARLGQTRFGQPVLAVDYEVVKAGEYNGATLIVHGDDGRRAQVILFGPLRSHGTLEVESRGFGGPFRAALPRNCEVYLVRSDARYGQPMPTFKVSSSAVLGTMTHLTRPRDWTAEEIARLSQPPPNYSNANAHPNVGQDTAFAGDTTGGIASRYVEPGGLLLGLDYRTLNWQGEKCLAGVTPVFNRTQPVAPLCSRVLAPEGYAVAGAKVRAKNYVNAVQLVFMRVKPDGRLDPADTKTSDWFGDADSQQPEKTLGGDGTRVIGVHLHAGAVVNGMALVLDNGGGKP